jgi:hypothetical protein
MTRQLASLLLILVSGSALAQHPRHLKRLPAPPPERAERADRVEHVGRIDMEGSKVTGQHNSSGAVSLYERKQLTERSMIIKPDNFRAEIYDAR